MGNRIIGRPWPAVLFVVLFLAGCASYGGRGLQPGVATLPDVLAVMGEPALRWQDGDGSLQLAFPRGPFGYHTWMVFIGTDGRMQRIENRLDPQYFNRLEPGKSDKAAVLRLFGPPVPEWSVYFEARNELVWEYRFCDSWGEAARLDVLFDATTGIVRSAYQQPESFFRDRPVACAR